MPRLHKANWVIGFGMVIILVNESIPIYQNIAKPFCSNVFINIAIPFEGICCKYLNLIYFMKLLKKYWEYSKLVIHASSFNKIYRVVARNDIFLVNWYLLLALSCKKGISSVYLRRLVAKLFRRSLNLQNLVRFLLARYSKSLPKNRKLLLHNLQG